MGPKDRNFAPLPQISIEDLVPRDHFYRHLDSSLDLSFLRELVKDHYSPIGRPSVDPVVFFKLQLVLFFEGLRSERQLMRHAADRLSLRWYLGYDLHESLPDHSSLTRIRERYGLEVFRRFFDEIVEQCIEAGLVWGEELYVDATKVEANAARASLVPRFAIDPHLRDLFKQEDTEGNESHTADQADGQDQRAESDTTPTLLSTGAPETVYEELAAANSARHDWIAEAGKQERVQKHHVYKRHADFLVSTTDPDATFMHRPGGSTRLGYQTHYVVDGGKARIVLQALVAPAEVTEGQPMRDLVWRVKFRWKLQPKQVTADTAYSAVDSIKALEDDGIHAYVPLAAPDSRRIGFSQQDFSYDPESDTYTCPQGTVLKRSQAFLDQCVTQNHAPASACNACPCKPNCTPSEQGRRLNRSFNEAYLERVRGYRETEAYKNAMRKRGVWVEPLFAEAKAWHGLRRFRLRTLLRVNAEAQLVAAGQNLKRLLSRRGWGRRSFPGGAAGVRVAPAPLMPG